MIGPAATTFGFILIDMPVEVFVAVALPLNWSAPELVIVPEQEEMIFEATLHL